MALIDLSWGPVNWVSLVNFHCSAPTAGDYKCTLGVDLGAGMFADMKSVNCEDQFSIDTNIQCSLMSSGARQDDIYWQVRGQLEDILQTQVMVVGSSAQRSLLSQEWLLSVSLEPG